MKVKGIAKSIIALIIVAIIIVAGVIAYVVTRPGVPPPEEEELSVSEMRIAHIIMGINGPWDEGCALLAKLYAEDLGYHSFVQTNPNWVEEKQITQLRMEINMGVDGILVHPLSTKGSNELIKKAVDEGIPVVTTNLDADSPDVSICIQYDGFSGARRLGEKFVEYLRDEVEPIGKVEGVLMDVLMPLEWSITINRKTGFESAFEDYPDVKIIDVLGEDQVEASKTAMLAKLAAMPEPPDGIFSTSWAGMSGSLSALEERGLFYPVGNPKHIYCASVDTMPISLDWIKNKEVDCIVGQPVHWYGPLALHYLNKVVRKAHSYPGPVDREAIKRAENEVLPDYGETVTVEDIVEDPDWVGEGKMHGEIYPWAEPDIWAPGEIVEKFGHRWLKLQGPLVDITNVDELYDSTSGGVYKKLKDAGISW